MNYYKLGLTVFLAVSLSGCFLTKIVTVPMRIVGAVASAVPVIGDAVDESMEAVADAVDDIPL
ncbi:MAG: hypothetical protein ACI9GE_000727 [Oceanospirillaceae bacterium]